jgi:WD40 repeat protein
MHLVRGLTIPDPGGIEAVSPDGRYLVTSSRTNTPSASVRDAATLRTVAELGPAGLGRAAFSPDGTLLVVAGKGVHAWSTVSWKPLWGAAEDANYYALALAPDGTTLYTGGLSVRAKGARFPRRSRSATRRRLRRARGCSRIPATSTRSRSAAARS